MVKVRFAAKERVEDWVEGKDAGPREYLLEPRKSSYDNSAKTPYFGGL